jgi:hypothetical protein
MTHAAALASIDLDRGRGQPHSRNQEYRECGLWLGAIGDIEMTGDCWFS